MSDCLTGNAGVVLELDRWFDAEPERVFRAFTDERQLQQWWGPRDFQTTKLEFSAAVGGRYRVELLGPDGGTYVHVGVIRELEPPRRLSYTWRWLNGSLQRDEMLVELDFVAEDGGTRVLLRHSGFVDTDSRTAHRGWPDSFDQLGEWLAPLEHT